MFKRFFIVVLLAGPFLVSCKNDDDANKGVIKLSSDEVSALLGIKDKAGIKIGEIESGPQGVKVKSISLKESDSTEVEIADVELRITSPSKLVYAISYLKIGKLDILDWTSSQRAQAFGIVVEKPGDGFLSKLDTAVSSTRASGSLKTADLTCERLGIDRLEYATHSKDNSMSVRLEDLSISQVNSDRIGELKLGSAHIGATVAGKGLKVTQVDRRWADQILARVVTFQSAQSNPTTQPAIDPFPATMPVVAKVELPSMGKRILPLDSLEVAELNFAIGKSAKGDQAPIKITSVHLDIQRKADGELSGITGNVNVAISPMGLADTEGAKKGFHDFFASFNPQLEQSIAITSNLKMNRDGAQNQEDTQIVADAPGVLSITLSGTTRGVATMIGELIANRDIRDESLPSISEIKLELRDKGLMAYLLSDRFEYHAMFLELLPSIPFQMQDAGDDSRLRRELKGFMRSPGGVTFTFNSQGGSFTPFKTFFKGDNSPGAAKAKISFASATPAPVELTPMDIQAAYTEYNSITDSGKAGTWLVQHCLDNLDVWTAAEKTGNRSARTLLASCLDQGAGIRPDHTEAQRLFHLSADAGDPLAARCIGNSYHFGSYGATKNYVEALRWYQIAANAGDTRAMVEIGKLYDSYDGDANGIPRDYAQAMAWYRKAADAGNGEGMECVGEFYAHGKGVQVNETEEFNWYFRAANAGRTYSMTRIGDYYATGHGVAPNMVEARKWYQKGADAGDRYAKEWLTKHPN